MTTIFCVTREPFPSIGCSEFLIRLLEARRKFEVNQKVTDDFSKVTIKQIENVYIIHLVFENKIKCFSEQCYNLT